MEENLICISPGCELSALVRISYEEEVAGAAMLAMDFSGGLL